MSPTNPGETPSVVTPQFATQHLTGIPQVDAEHRVLFELINFLFGANCASMQSEALNEKFSETFSELGRKLCEHFDHEEVVLRQIGMPDALIQPHVHSHFEILEQYTQLNMDMIESKSIPRANLQRLVSTWIVDHFDQHDSMIRHYAPAS